MCVKTTQPFTSPHLGGLETSGKQNTTQGETFGLKNGVPLLRISGSDWTLQWSRVNDHVLSLCIAGSKAPLKLHWLPGQQPSHGYHIDLYGRDGRTTLSSHFLKQKDLFSYKQKPILGIKTIVVILLMEEILHHLGCIKPCK